MVLDQTDWQPSPVALKESHTLEGEIKMAVRWLQMLGTAEAWAHDKVARNGGCLVALPLLEEILRFLEGIL
jgi:hypothetical protein